MNMGVFSGNQELVGLGQKQVCKRDLKGDIAELRAQVKASSALLLAVEDYCDTGYHDGNEGFTLNSLIGGLTREVKQINRSITALQEEWESELAKK